MKIVASDPDFMSRDYGHGTNNNNRRIRVRTVTNGKTEYKEVDLDDLIKYREEESHT